MVLRKGIFVAATLFLLSLALLQGKEDSLLREARSRSASGDTADALALYTEYKLENPSSLEPYLESANLLIENNRKNDASIELREALRVGAKTPEEAVQLATLLDRIGNPVIASQVLEGYQYSPSLAKEGLWLLADLYYQQRKFEEALRVLKTYSKRPEIDSNRLHLQKGKILLEMGALDKSLEAFESLAQNDPSSAEAFHGLSKACFFGNNMEAALEMSSRAVELEPDNPLYLHQLGAVRKALGEDQEAITTLEKARELGADVFSISFELGDLYRKVGKVDKARQALQTYQDLLSKRLEEQEQTQLINQGEKELQEQQLTAAQTTFEEVLKSDPENWTAHNRLAKIHLALGNPLQAVHHLEQLLQIDPQSSEPHFLLAALGYSSRDYETAFDHALRSKELLPGNPDLRNILGNLYFIRGDEHSAAEEYRAAMLLAPNRSEFKANYQAVSKTLE